MSLTLTRNEQSSFLGDHGDAVLTTCDAGGRPIPLPVWYVVQDGDIYVRTPRRSRRMVHLRHDPTVALLVHDGHTWRELRGVLIHGRVQVVEDPALVAAVCRAIDDRFADRLPPSLPHAMTARYDQVAVLRIVPTGTTVSWDNRKVRL